MNTLSDTSGIWMKRAPFGSGTSVAPAPLTQAAIASPSPVSVKEKVQEQVEQTMEQSSGAAAILRRIGALTVIAAMSAFLLQGWSAGNDTGRFYLMLAQSVLLTLGGLSMSFLLKENKGARVFFGLALVSITTDMTTLGALVYSLAQWDGGLVSYPALAHWKASGWSATLLAGLAGVGVLVPLALFAFTVLARRSARLLAGLSLLANLMLLVPVRHSLAVGMVAMLGILVPVLACRRLMAQDATLRTKEGYFAAGSLLAPAAVILVRSLWLYPVDASLALVLDLTGFAVLRIVTPLVAGSAIMEGVMGLASCLLAAGAGVALGDLVSPLGSYGTLAFAILFTPLSLDVAQRSSRYRQSFATLAAWVLAISQCLPAMVQDDAVSQLGLLLAGIAVIAMGRHFARRSLLMLGALMVAAALMRQAWSILVLIDFSHWLTLAVLGVAALVAASVIERHGAVLRLKWQRLCSADRQRD